MSPDGILAAGTFNNTVSLFSSTYDHISSFSLSNGTGTTEIKWSPNARDMYIVPRNSNSLEIWDVRNTGTKIATLVDRQASTNQRLWTDLTQDGKYFVSGGTDGYVRSWSTEESGTVEPTMKIKVHDGLTLMAMLMRRLCKFSDTSSILVHVSHEFGESSIRL